MIRIRKLRDVFLVDAGNVHFSGTIQEMEELKNALQVAIDQALSEKEEAKK